MKKTFLSVILFFIVAGNGYTQQESFALYPEIQYEDFAGFRSERGITCVGSFNLEKGGKERQEFMVTNREEYKELFDCKMSHFLCDNFVFPEIDFSQKILLGKYVSWGCSADISKEVYRDDVNKKIVYSIHIVERGSCERLGMAMNWILIPKIPSDYNIKFKVSKDTSQK